MSKNIDVKHDHWCEVIIHDEIARSLAHLFLPPAGSHVSGEELRAAAKRLVEATLKMKRLMKQQEREVKQ